MKSISFILSLIIFTLSVLPCSDAYTCEEGEGIAQSEAHDHSEDTEDGCSPFCACTCCGIKMPVPAPFDLGISPEEETDRFSFTYRFLYSFRFSKSSWRPPAYC